MRSSLKIYGLTICRNEADVIRPCILHQLGMGLDKILVIDNGSTDSTHKELYRLARQYPVKWRSEPDRDFLPGQMYTELARQAYSEGAEWVVPADADEFYYAASGNIRTALERETESASLSVSIVQFVQRRSQRETVPSGLLTMTMRVPEQKGATLPEAGEMVLRNEIGFVERLLPQKIIARPSQNIEYSHGNHEVYNLPEGYRPKKKTSELVSLHAGYRSLQSFTKKAEAGKRAAVGRNPRQSKHKQRWADMLDAGQLEREWAANSYKDGHLDVYGEHHELVEDTRLADTVRRYVEPRWKRIARRVTGG